MKRYTPSKLPLSKLTWEAFVHLVGKANAEVARFDGLLQTIPNPSVDGKERHKTYFFNKLLKIVA